jgi:hypothetical protein
MSTKSDKLAGTAILIAGWGLFLVGTGVLATECWQWLRTGTWPAVAIGRGLAWLGIDNPIPEGWLGAQAIARWLLAQSLSAGLVVLGLLLIWAGFLSVDEADRRMHIERQDA